MQKQPPADCFYFRSPLENVPQHQTALHRAKLSAAQWGTGAVQGALICLGLSQKKSHLSSLWPVLPHRV